MRAGWNGGEVEVKDLEVMWSELGEISFQSLGLTSLREAHRDLVYRKGGRHQVVP